MTNLGLQPGSIAWLIFDAACNHVHEVTLLQRWCSPSRLIGDEKHNCHPCCCCCCCCLFLCPTAAAAGITFPPTSSSNGNGNGRSSSSSSTVTATITLPQPLISSPSPAAAAAAAAKPAAAQTLMSMDEDEMSAEQLACRDTLRAGKRLLKQGEGAGEQRLVIGDQLDVEVHSVNWLMVG
jgi:hypothetical protein